MEGSLQPIAQFEWRTSAFIPADHQDVNAEAQKQLIYPISI